uniref:sigma-70 family RNA polymerase sigma factor n=1 Tax=Streptomyces triticisoli TaxID=2182797 RepID=UPI000DD98EDF
MTPLSSHRPPAGQAGEEPRLSSELIDGLVRDVCAIPPGPERQAARERVIRRLVPLARRIAAKYRNIAGEEQDDLFQAACLGLVRAVDGYDPDRGHAFLSYAVPTVAGEVKRHLRDRTGTLRIPRPVQDARQRVNRARGELEQLNGRPATRAEVAAYCDLPTEAVTEALRSESVRRPRPLDAPADGTDLPGPTPSEVIGGCDPALELLVERVTLIRLLNELPDRERRILYLRFFEDRTQQQIASAVGISQMHVSRLLARCLAHLREALTDPYGTEVTGAGPSARAKDAAAGLRTAGPPHLPPEEPRRRGGPV